MYRGGSHRLVTHPSRDWRPDWPGDEEAVVPYSPGRGNSSLRKTQENAQARLARRLRRLQSAARPSGGVPSRTVESSAKVAISRRLGGTSWRLAGGPGSCSRRSSRLVLIRYFSAVDQIRVSARRRTYGL